MKKNSEYVGVDEKFVPEGEKYVKDSVLGNREESKRKIAKGLKVGLGIYLGFGALVLIIFVIIFMSVFNMIKDTNEHMYDFYEDTTNTIIDGIQNNKDVIKDFNDLIDGKDDTTNTEKPKQESTENANEETTNEQTKQEVTNNIDDFKDIVNNMNDMMNQFVNGN